MLSYKCNRVSGLECSEKRRYIIPNSFLALEQAVSMCGDHDKSEVSNNPRYLKHSTCSSVCPLTNNGGASRRVLFLDMSIVLHFLTLRWR